MEHTMTIAEIERESGDDDDDVNGFFFQFEHKRSDRRLRKGEGRAIYIPTLDEEKGE